MKGRSLLALAVLSVALACQDDKLPTGPSAPTRISTALSDGAHGDNADFFFLPPLVKLKKNPDFVVGTFNNTLKPRLTIEICQLNTTITPTDFTECVTGAPVKTFAPGEVNLVNLPSGKKDVPKHFKFEEWWKGGHHPADGFYYVMWDTRQPGLTPLNLDKFYRINVILKGTRSSDPDFVLGFADVDPKPKEGPKWKYSRTRDLIEMVAGVMLPIPFRVENIGGHCSSTDFCTQATVTNVAADGTGSQLVQVEGGAGAIAGARFPDGWLPAGGPQSVVVTIFEIPSEEAGDGTRTTPCHAGLPLEQFNKCFRFITTPVLASNKNGDQFAQFVTVAVCYTLENGGDPRKNFAELWASGPNEETRPLPNVSDAGILGAGARGCEVGEVGLESSNPVIRLASSGWRMLKRGLSQALGVKTAYAVDQGLGGIIKGFTNIGAALSATIEAYPNPAGGNHLLSLSSGVATASVRIVGSPRHAGEGAYAPDGINNVLVTFTLAPGNGSLFDGEGSGPEVTRRTTSINEGESTVDGIASVQWTPPNTPGTYRMTASGPTTNGPITFTARVTATLLPDLIVSSGGPVLGPSEVGTGGGVVGISGYTITNQGSAFVLDGNVSAGVYLSTDPTITASDTRITGGFIGSAFGAGSSFNAPAEEFSIPARQAGLYYLGVLADEQNIVGESNEGNNYASTPLLISDVIDFETYPSGSGVCDGADSCDVTSEFASLGVVFSFDQLLPGESNASLCKKGFNPVGESPNYGVSPNATVGCSTWNSGTVTMSFASRPKAVEFQLQGNNAVSVGPFPVTASDANGNAVTVTRESVVTYSPSTGLTFRREIRRAISAVGIASVSVVSNAGVVFIDNLLIAP